MVNFDSTVRLSDIVVAGTILLAGWRFVNVIRDEMRDLKKTVYGSVEPPVEGLVSSIKRIDAHVTEHRQILSDLTGK